MEVMEVDRSLEEVCIKSSSDSPVIVEKVVVNSSEADF